MDELIEGYRKFRAEIWPAERARYEPLAHWGQSPEAMVIACSDSRGETTGAGDCAEMAPRAELGQTRASAATAIDEPTRKDTAAAPNTRRHVCVCWACGSRKGVTCVTTELDMCPDYLNGRGFAMK